MEVSMDQCPHCRRPLTLREPRFCPVCRYTASEQALAEHAVHDLLAQVWQVVPSDQHDLAFQALQRFQREANQIAVDHAPQTVVMPRRVQPMVESQMQWD